MSTGEESLYYASNIPGIPRTVHGFSAGIPGLLGRRLYEGSFNPNPAPPSILYHDPRNLAICSSPKARFASSRLWREHKSLRLSGVLFPPLATGTM